jgi:hypothetical protein
MTEVWVVFSTVSGHKELLEVLTEHEAHLPTLLCGRDKLHKETVSHGQRSGHLRRRGKCQAPQIHNVFQLSSHYSFPPELISTTTLGLQLWVHL